MSNTNLTEATLALAQATLKQRAPELMTRLHEQEMAEEGPPPRITLGGESTSLIGPREWRRAARTMEAALGAQIAASTGALRQTRRGLAVAGRWQLAADVIAVVGPATIFTVLKADAPRLGQYLSAIITLVAAVIAVVSRYQANMRLRQGSKLEYFQEVLETREEASAIVREIQTQFRREPISTEQMDLLTRANNACEKLGKMLGVAEAAAS